MNKITTIQIDTTKVPNESLQLWAEIIGLSVKFNQSIDKTIEEMKSQLRKREE